jgi:MFS family permease
MRRYVVSVSAGFGLFMYAIDTTAVAVAFPNFIKDFDTNVLWAGWTISIYLVAVTSAMPLMGNLSDTFGRKKVFVYSLILLRPVPLPVALRPISTAWWYSGSFKASGEQAFSQRQQAS